MYHLLLLIILRLRLIIAILLLYLLYHSLINQADWNKVNSTFNIQHSMPTCKILIEMM